MESKFKKSWKSSKQPRKQRKFRINAPLHIKRKFLAAHLSKELRGVYGKRNIEVRKGDEVKIMRGKLTGKTGKVGIIDLKNTRIQIDGITREKRTGEKIITWFSPSKVMIISLDTSDAKRFKKKVESKIEVKTETKKENKTENKNAHKKK